MADFVGTESGETITGTAGDDTIQGLGGNDTLNGQGGIDAIDGGEGDDTVDGGGGADMLNGGNGNDSLTDGSLPDNAIDQLLGGAGDDLLTSVSGADTIDGGIGADTVRIVRTLSATAFTIDMSTIAGTPVNIGDGTTLSNVEALIFEGGSGNDIIIGGVLADVLQGGLGDDNLSGGAGIDTLSGGEGADVLFGGAGVDTMDGGGGVDFLLGQDGDDILTTGAGEYDAAYGGLGNDTLQNTGATYSDLYGDEGDDIIIAGAMVDGIIDGGVGIDRLEAGLTIEQFEITGVEHLALGAGGTTATASQLAGFESIFLNGAPAAGVILRLAAAGTVDLTTQLGVRAVQFTGTIGDDGMTSSAGADQLNGLAGNDILSAGAGADVLDGGDGDDQLDGGADNDTLSGMAGADLAHGGSGADSILGGLGSDELYGDDGADQIDGGGDNDFLAGGVGIDQLTGGDGDDFLDGGADGDVISGGAGLDFAVGGAGDDQILGGLGVDQLFGDDGADQLSGEADNDVLSGGLGVDQLDGGDGNDTLDGGLGSDTASYSSASSAVSVRLLVAGAQNTVGAGIDTLISIENLRGSGFSDTLTGDGGANALFGGAGDDQILGGLGVDQLFGDDGADQLDGGAGDDSLDGGLGSDTASYASTASGVVVTLLVSGAQNTIGAGIDTLISIENLKGSGFSDTLTGDGGANALFGGAGDDQILGGLGVDQLDGGAGDDSLDGGLGSDTASYASTASGVVVTLLVSGAQNTIGAGIDTLISIENLKGSGFSDTLTGDGGANTLEGGAGSDVLDGGSGLDTASYASSGSAVFINLATGSIAGGDAAGDTYLSIESLTGSAFGDDLRGDAGANILSGGAGADYLYGQGGSDTLNAGDGDDYVYFDAADLAGGSLAGGAGYDWAFLDELNVGVSLNLAATGFEGAYGRNGNDTFNASGSTSSVTLYGNGGADTLTGGSGDDYIYFDALDLSGGELTGGSGYDWAILNEHVSVSLNLATTGFEGGYGRDGNDTFDASGLAISVTLYGNGGADTLTGGSGDDYIYFDAADLSGGSITGGSGYDWAILNEHVGISFNLAARGFEGGYGRDGADTFDASGMATSVTLYGNGGADTLIGGSGGDYIYFDAADLTSGSIAGGAGYDYAIFNELGVGTSLNLTATGFEGAVGRNGNDTFTAAGSAGSVSLYGYEGNDSLTGGSGSDYLYGDVGNDTLTGGGGTDYFITYTGWGADTLTDFQQGVDRVVMSVAGLTAFSQLTIAQDGADALVSYNGASLRFSNTSAASIDVSDFLNLANALSAEDPQMLVAAKDGASGALVLPNFAVGHEELIADPASSAAHERAIAHGFDREELIAGTWQDDWQQTFWSDASPADLSHALKTEWPPWTIAG